MVPPPIRTEILARIRRAEDEHDVRVLLAVESGSRAWGFESPNSDFDARFIYVHRQDWYLSVGLEEQRDVIEYKIVDDIDLNGWDVRKALRLFWKSNPAFVE
jgi:predicted nucleotidyltransferase